jgi:hypothetical protein
MSTTKHSKANYRRRNKRWKERARRTASAPIAGNSAASLLDSIEGSEGVCKTCLNHGTFYISIAPNTPKLVQYCKCPYGAARLANAVNVLQGLHVEGAAQVTVRQVTG